MIEKRAVEKTLENMFLRRGMKQSPSDMVGVWKGRLERCSSHYMDTTRLQDERELSFVLSLW